MNHYTNTKRARPVSRAQAMPDLIACSLFSDALASGVIQDFTLCTDPTLQDLGTHIASSKLGQSTQLARVMKQARERFERLPPDLLRKEIIIGDGESQTFTVDLREAILAKEQRISIDTILIGDSEEGEFQLRELAARTVGGRFFKVDTFKALTDAVLASPQRLHRRTAAKWVLLDNSLSMTNLMPGVNHTRLQAAAAAINALVKQTAHLYW